MKNLTRREGQSLILAVGSLSAVVMICAFCIDVGALSATKAELQNGADAAALAAVQTLTARRAEGMSEADSRAAAASAAADFAGRNNQGTECSVEFGVPDSTGQFSPVDASAAASMVRARVFRSQEAAGGELPLAFSGLFGLRSAEVQATATAYGNGYVSAYPAPLLPIGVPESAVGKPGEEMTFYPADSKDYDGDGWGDSSVAPGNWGLLNLNGGSLSNTELEDWIRNGYSGEVAVSDTTADGQPSDDPYDADSESANDVWLAGNCGFRSSLESALQSRIGDTVCILIYDDITGSGATADFHVTGFLKAKLNSADIKGSDRSATVAIEKVDFVSGIPTGAAYPSPNVVKVHLVG